MPDPRIDILNYNFSINLNDTTDIIEATAIVKIRIAAVTNTIYLELRNQGEDGKGMAITSLSCDRAGISWTHSENKLRVMAESPFKPGSIVNITINYGGTPSDGLIISRNKYGRRVFFADHWPDRASNYLPVITHPSDKATVDFIISAPAKYKIIASGHLLEESETNDGYRTTHWKEDVPLPVKVMAFAAAEFEVNQSGMVDNIPVTSWVYPENKMEGFSDYSVAVKPLKVYAEIIGEYPFEKLANVQSRTIFGGLENAGNIFYSENSVSGKGSAEGLIAHEIAHQWFGDSVTERDWYHIWLSEGFATYLTSMYLENVYGAERLRESMRTARERVLRASARALSPVIDTSVTDLMKLLSTNSYQKGAWVLHMLRNEIGDSAFVQGLQEYYRTYRDSTALTADFMRVMESVSGKSLEGFFNQWLFFAGEPALKIYTFKTGKGDMNIVIEQTQELLYDFNIEIGITDSNNSRIMKIPVNQRITYYRIMDGNDLKIEPDPYIKLLYREVKQDL